MSSSNNRERIREEAVRQRLLVELSVLRDQYAALTGNQCVTPAPQIDAAEMTGGLVRSSAAALAARRESDQSDEALDQNDRDAIEAFFNNSEDDFVRLFNNGQGQIQRSEMLTE